MAQVDTPQKLQDLFNLYVNDGELAIGLSDVGGQNWQWDGPNNIKVDFNTRKHRIRWKAGIKSLYV